MKIALIVGGLPPEYLGGTEVATLNIARHLVKRGHDVHIIIFLDGGLPEERMEQGFYVHRITWPKVRRFGILLLWIKALIVLKKINPDVIHIQSIANGMIGFWAKKFLRKSYVVWGQGLEVYSPWPYKKQFSKLAIKNANAVIALTDDMRQEMQKTCNREILIIPNGIDLERFEHLLRNEIRDKLRSETGEKLLIFVGRFRPEKGVRYLIEAMPIIRQKGQPVKLILGGEGPEEDNLKQLVGQLNLGNCVNFIGQIPNEKVPQYMVAADVFVLPSLSEGLPVVVLEAMASGLPIVATRVRGLPEIIEDGKNGLLVEPKSPEQIAEKLCLLLGDDELRRRLSENNKAKVKEYSWESIISQLEKLYEQLVKK